MAKPKYKEFFELMMKNNSEAFEAFAKIHAKYGLNPEENQEEFNREGATIQRILYEWEDKLCNRTQSSGYGNYAGNLAEKFREEVRREFPHIDSIGIGVFKVDKIKLE
jgi:hypothetical protein